MTSTIIILAMIAAFLGFRLYSALGKHGQDGTSPLPSAEERARTAPPAPSPPSLDTLRPQPGQRPADLVYEPAAEIGIRAIFAADRGFDIGRFMTGAQAAYRLILEAFWRGDKDALAELCDADSLAAFSDAIDARAERGETLDNRLVTIDKAMITAAEMDGPLARITVRFDADIAAVTRDSDGRMVAGSMTDAVATQDVWSFIRRVDSDSPNWLLDETDAT